jgi:UV DNA damage endonuclease
MKLGYACINNTLAEKEIVVNRSMVKKTFASKGVSYASELALKNVIDLEKVIDWNIRYKMLFYRLSSDMFPWMSEYELNDLPDIRAIDTVLDRIGKKVVHNDVRLTFHPGPFNVLATTNESVLTKTLKELRQHGEIMDKLGLPRSPYAKINIHIGASYGDKQSAMERFCKNFAFLDPGAATRLTVENDDKANMFSVNDLIYVHERTGIPIVFDYLHHKFCTGGLSEAEALTLAISTWPKSIKPVVHYSSAKKAFEDEAAAEAAHAHFIYDAIDTFGNDVDVMLEAKAKELAVKKYKRMFTASNVGS